MKKNLSISLAIIAFISCSPESSKEYKQMQQQNDSLKLQMAKNEAEVEDILNIFNEIEENMRSIREAENFLDVQKDAEISVSRREKIRNNLATIKEILKTNKEQLAELQEKLEKGNIHSAALQKTINRLTAELNSKTKQIAQLQQDLSKKDHQIKNLSEQVENLNTDLNILEDVSEEQHLLIESQEKALNTVYYCFGTKKELKEQDILTGGGLFSKSKALQEGFNKEYFIEIDKRKVKTIPLYASKAKVRTNHPEGSFSIEKDQDGNLALVITDPQRFWELGKFLVIEVK